MLKNQVMLKSLKIDEEQCPEQYPASSQEINFGATNKNLREGIY